MELHEYYVKKIFKDAGLPVLPGGVAYTSQEAMAVASKMKQGPFWVKPQILLGYSPEKKDDILLKKILAETPKDVFNMAEKILGTALRGYPADVSSTIQRVYVEQAVQQ